MEFFLLTFARSFDLALVFWSSWIVLFCLSELRFDGGGDWNLHFGRLQCFDGKGDWDLSFCWRQGFEGGGNWNLAVADSVYLFF